MPYVYNWSQDVEKCTLDLVSSSFTHTNAIQTIALASKGGQKFIYCALYPHLHLLQVQLHRNRTCKVNYSTEVLN